MADTAAAMDEIDADDGLVVVVADGAAKRQRTSKPESVKRAECLRNWQLGHAGVMPQVITDERAVEVYGETGRLTCTGCGSCIVVDNKLSNITAHTSTKMYAVRSFLLIFFFLKF